MENTFKNKALYHQPIDLLREQIETCMISRDKLPSERELTAQYGVGRTTIRLALRELENRGSTYRRHGKGTFASDMKKETVDLASVYSFTEQMKGSGRKPHTRILSFEKLEANKFIYRHLDLSLGEAVLKLSRLRIADNEPLMVEDIHLPAKFFLSLMDQLLCSKPLCDLFSEDFKQTVCLTDEELCASIVSKEDARLLMIPEGTPVLHSTHQTYNMKNEIIEFASSVARADQFHYQIRHIRNSQED